MAGVKGSQPSNLASTNINAADEEASAPQMGDLSGFQQDPESDAEDAAISAQNDQSAAPAAQAKPSLDDIFGGSQGQAQASSAPSLDDIFGSDTSQAVQPDQTDAEDTRGSISLASVSQQIQEAPTRFKASFAKTDKEKEQVLKETYGEDGVKKQDGEFYIKKDGKFRKFDSKNFELISDVLDFGRDAVEQGVAGVTTAAGAILGAGEVAGSGGLAAPAGLATLAAARGIGGAMGVDAADKTAEAMGIQRDPSRSKTGEMVGGAAGQAIGGAMMDNVPGLAKKVANSKAGQAIGSGVKKAGSQAYHFIDEITGGVLSDIAAKRAAQAEANKFVPGEKIAQDSVNDVIKLADKVKESGLIQDLPGTNSPISAAQAGANTINPGLQLDNKAVMNTKAGQGYITEQTKMINNAIDKIGKSISEASPTGPEADASLSKQFSTGAGAVEKAWGSTIGAFRDMAKLSGGEVETASTAKSIGKLGEEFGFSRKGGELVTPGEDSAFALLPKPVQLSFKNLQEKIYNSEGKLSFAELNNEYNKISSLMNASKDNTSTFSYLTQIKNGLRDDMTEGIGTLLNGAEDKAAYQKALTRFSGIKDSVDKLGGVFDKDEVTGRAMTKAIFGEGLGGLDKIRAAKNLIEPENPQLWQRMKADYFKNISEEAGGDSKKIIAKLTKLGDESLKEIMNDSSGIKPGDIKEFGNLLGVLHKSDATAMAGPELGRMARLGYVGKRILKADVGAVADLFSSSPNAQEFFSRGGVNKLAGIVAPKDRPFFLKVGQMVADQAGKKALSNQVQSQTDQLVNPLQGSPNAVPGR